MKEDDLDMDNDDAGDDDGMAPHEHIQAGIAKACQAILADDTLKAREKADRIKKLLLSHEKLTADAGGETEDDEEEDDESDDADQQRPGDAKRKSAGDADKMAESIARLLRLSKGERRLAEAKKTKVKLSLKDFARKLLRGL